MSKKKLKKHKARCAKRIKRKNKRPYLILTGDEVERFIRSHERG